MCLEHVLSFFNLTLNLRVCITIPWGGGGGLPSPVPQVCLAKVGSERPGENVRKQEMRVLSPEGRLLLDSALGAPEKSL